MRARRQVVSIPIIVEPVVVPVPLAVIAPIEIQHVAVAVRVAQICRMPSVPLPLEYSPG